ncbi:TPA: excinuclease ABC subunit C [Patescibacteria group bacterium]|nr:excinuclease ABC subunit C [Patescibacteria group bacterium]
MYYTYVLFSEKDKNFYVGYTHNVALRFEQHCGGQVDSTKNRRPLLLIYFEGGLDKQDALNREKYLKTFYGRMFLGKRLKSYFTRLHNETSHNNPENR